MPLEGYDFVMAVKISSSEVDKSLAELALCWQSSKLFNGEYSFHYPKAFSEAMLDFIPHELKARRNKK